MTKKAKPKKDAGSAKPKAAEAENVIKAEIGRERAAAARPNAAIDKAFRNIRVLVLGALAGTAAAIAFGAMIYFQMRTEFLIVSSAQTKSLIVFAENIDRLSEAITITEDMQSEQRNLLAALQEQTAGATAGLAEFKTSLSGEILKFTERADALSPELAATIRQHTDKGLAAVSDEMRKIISDLQLAMSKMVAANGGFVGAANADELAAITKELRVLKIQVSRAAAAQTKRPSTRSKPRTASRAQPAENPIHFP